MPTAKKTIQDHDEDLTEGEILEGVPPLLHPSAFRQRQRSTVLRLMNRLRSVANDDGEIDTQDENTVVVYLDVIADADEFFESIAMEPKTYVGWSTGLKNSEQIFGTLIAKYARAVGE